MTCAQSFFVVARVLRLDLSSFGALANGSLQASQRTFSVDSLPVALAPLWLPPLDDLAQHGFEGHDVLSFYVPRSP